MRCFLQVWLILTIIAIQVFAQTTAFNYQGRLTDGGSAANGAYQMQFKLFDALAGGSQIGSTIADVPITATNGVFNAKLNFGSNALSGANRWLEIAVRRNSGESYVTLAPREQINSSPYAVRTLSAASADNALQLGGIPASDYVTNASVGSSFVRNGTTLQTANFNISGNGFIGGNLGVGTNSPAHRLAVLGGPCWTGDCWGGALELENASAIGWRQNTAGVKFGIGRTENGLFFFRTNSPLGTANNGSVYDFKLDNFGNVGIGNLGISTDLTGAKLNVLTGNGYGVVQSNGSVTVGSYLDSTGGWLGTRSNHPLYFFTNDSSPKMTLTTNGDVLIGTNIAPARLNVGAAAGDGLYSSTTSTGGKGIYGQNLSPNSNSDNIGVRGDSTFGKGVMGWTDTGYAVYGFAANQTSGYAGYFYGNVAVGYLSTTLRTGGVQQVCINTNFFLAGCSSSLRYKKDFQPFTDGLSFINQLRPISFRWKSNDDDDIGFGAEDVARINPLFVTYNEKGEIEGVKYDRLSLVFVNAIKEQQQQIERQTEIIKRQQQQIDALIKLNCLQNSGAEICREEK